MVLRLLEYAFLSQKYPGNIFLKISFPPSEMGVEGEETMRLLKKMTKIKLVRVLVASFNTSHHLCILHIFGFCFAVHNLDSNILTCEGSLTQPIKVSRKSIACRNNYMKDKDFPYPIFLTISLTICQIKIFIFTFSPTGKVSSLYLLSKMLSQHSKIIQLKTFNLELNLSLISNKAPNFHCVIRSEMNTASIKNK